MDVNLAACRGEDPELFFPLLPPGGRSNPDGMRIYQIQVKMAKAVCAECPLQAECLELYLTEPFGIFGGLTAHQREQLRKGRGMYLPTHPERPAQDYSSNPASVSRRRKRAAAKVEKREYTHCRNEHEMTPENTIVRKKTGFRECRECVNARLRVYRRKQRAEAREAA